MESDISWMQWGQFMQWVHIFLLWLAVTKLRNVQENR